MLPKLLEEIPHPMLKSLWYSLSRLDIASKFKIDIVNQ